MKEYVYSNAIHQRLFDIRKALGLSQRDMGKKLGRSNAFYSNLENRTDSYIGENVILAVCNTFSVNYDYLVFGDGEMFNEQDRRKKALADMYSDLAEPFQHCALEYMEYLKMKSDRQKKKK